MEPIVEDMTVDKSARHGNIGPLLVPGTWDAVFWLQGTRKLISHLHGVIPIRALPTPPGKSSYNVSRRFGIRVDLVVRPDGDQSFPPEIRAYTPGTAYHGTVQGQIQYRSEEIRDHKLPCLISVGLDNLRFPSPSDSRECAGFAECCCCELVGRAIGCKIVRLRVSRASEAVQEDGPALRSPSRQCTLRFCTPSNGLPFSL